MKSVTRQLTNAKINTKTPHRLELKRLCKTAHFKKQRGNEKHFYFGSSSGDIRKWITKLFWAWIGLCLVAFDCIFGVAMTTAGQVVNEVWFPAGIIRWSSTQFEGGVLPGVRDAFIYFNNHTPIQLSEIKRDKKGQDPEPTNQGGVSQPNQFGVLEIRYAKGVFKSGYGGLTKHYRKSNQGKKIVKLSKVNVRNSYEARQTMAHEMGHVLGFTHEFQRWDRGANGVKVGVFGGPYNFDKPDSGTRILSPYDVDSAFSTGYTDKVTPAHEGPQDGSLLSKRDINSIYRVYGRSLGRLEAGLRYGEALASGDFDGDGIADLAIAARHSEPGADSGAIYFYKGVEQSPFPVVEGTGTTYVAWFREDVSFAAGQDHRIVLTVGDTHMMPDPSRAIAVSDGIDELILGLPGAGRVEIWVVNSAGRFSDGLGTYGGRGIGNKVVIEAKDVGIDSVGGLNGFGSSLATGRFMAGNGDDLAIGAPLPGGLSTNVGGVASVGVNLKSPLVAPSGGPAVYLLPDVNPDQAVKIVDPSGETTSEFGAALAVMRKFDHRHDTLVVGAPGARGRGEVFIYRRAYTNAGGDVIKPTLLDSLSGATVESRFGKSLAAFTTREEGAGSTEHWIAVGAPDAVVSAGLKSGTVELYNFKYSGERKFQHRLYAPDRQEGMNFGQSIAVQQGKCEPLLCPKGLVWLAISSPRALVNGGKAGQVYLWNVWADGKLTRQTARTWHGGNDRARYGQEVIAVRAKESGGGFLVAAKRGELPVIDGSVSRPVETGLAQLRFNLGGPSEWKSWVLTLGPNRAGDKLPDNR